MGFIIFGLIVYNIWKSLKGGSIVESEVASVSVGAGSGEGGREDYIRGYYVSTEREPDGFGENVDGYRSGERF